MPLVVDAAVCSPGDMGSAPTFDALERTVQDPIKIESTPTRVADMIFDYVYLPMITELHVELLLRAC
jgi:hypothetical protein